VAYLVSRYVKNSGDVADVAQEAFIKAYRALPSFRGESAFYTWLYRIAVNSAKNYLVSQGRKPPANDVDADDADFYDGSDALKENNSPEKSLMSAQMEKALFTTLEQLPEDLRMAISLRELDGMSYEDIANVMDCPVGTVRSRIFRAREALDKVIQPLLMND
jgi:RNA polymerase sigma-70 factor, ECF subfamily